MSAAEPIIICPKCRAEIKLLESLAEPLVESIRRDYEGRLARKDTDMAKACHLEMLSSPKELIIGKTDGIVADCRLDVIAKRESMCLWNTDKRMSAHNGDMPWKFMVSQAERGVKRVREGGEGSLLIGSHLSDQRFIGVKR